MYGLDARLQDAAVLPADLDQKSLNVNRSKRVFLGNHCSWPPIRRLSSFVMALVFSFRHQFADLRNFSSGQHSCASGSLISMFE
jgi:hypothetical protein